MKCAAFCTLHWREHSIPFYKAQPRASDGAGEESQSRASGQRVCTRCFLLGSDPFVQLPRVITQFSVLELSAISVDAETMAMDKTNKNLCLVGGEGERGWRQFSVISCVLETDACEWKAKWEKELENVGGIRFITLGRVSRGGLVEEVIFRGKWEGIGDIIWGKNYPGSGSSTCKGPVAGVWGV